MNVALGVAAFVISYGIFNSNLKTAFAVILISTILLYPFVLRWARNIYINIFVSFNPNKDKA
jgi:Ca2+/Na+ antiporter